MQKVVLCFISFGNVQKYNRLCWEVTGIIKQLAAIDLHDDPAACLLHLSERPIQKYKASLTSIPFRWTKKKLNPLMKSLGFTKVNELGDMEELTAALCYAETWRPNKFAHSD